MARDETRDVGISSDSLEVRMWSQVDNVTRFARYVPHSRLAYLERQFAEAKTERDFWRKKHQDDNEGLMFQLGRNLEFAQAAAFRHGATEPHPTIKCIQIIDEHAESLRRQLADREDAIREAMALIESDYEDEAYNRLAKALEKP